MSRTQHSSAASPRHLLEVERPLMQRRLRSSKSCADERILARFDGTLRQTDGTVRCGFTIGAARSADGSEGVGAFGQQADVTLYSAKQAGKGVVHVTPA